MLLGKKANRPGRRRPAVIAGVAGAAISALVLTACGGTAGGGNGGGSSSNNSSGASSTLTFGDNGAGAIPQDFNPFEPATVQPDGDGATAMIYEPLIQFNLAAPPAYTPWLATSFKWSNGGKTITFTIRQGVKFSNGTPLTPADVAYTYTMIKQYPTANPNGINPTSVQTSGNTVTLTFASAQYAALQQVAGVPIIPKSIWSTVGDPSKYADATPIGTGPYTLKSFSSQGFTLQKNPNYWQPGKPVVQNVYFPAYTSNTSSLNALVAGGVDWNGNFIQNVQQVFVAKNPSTNHIWPDPLGTQGLLPNLTTWPTNQLAVRQAISLAVDRTKINAQAESSVSAPMANTSALTLPTFKAWQSAATGAGQLNVTAQPSAAEQVLIKAGYKKDSAGFFALNGKEVAITLTDPSSYTDYAQADAIMAQDLQAAGINATFQGTSVSGWTSAIASGNFQLTLYWCNYGNTPWDMYNGWLNSALVSNGTASGDYERLNDPAIDNDLATLAASQTVAQQISALEPIETYVANNLPVIPLMTRVAFFNYSTARFTGWPTASNPYQSPVTNGNPGIEQIILNLTPVSK